MRFGKQGFAGTLATCYLHGARGFQRFDETVDRRATSDRVYGNSERDSPAPGCR